MKIYAGWENRYAMRFAFLRKADEFSFESIFGVFPFYNTEHFDSQCNALLRFGKNIGLSNGGIHAKQPF